MQIEGRTTSLLDCYAEMQLILCKSTKKSVFLYIMGGGNLNRLFVFFDICQNKVRSGYGVIPVSKAMVWQQKSYDMTSNESFYLRLKMNIRLREISAQLNIRKCFFEHESHKSDESFYLRLKMNIRLIRDISVQLNIRECIFFSNTNRTNLTNLLGCDMVYIRGIREITSLWSVGLRQISWSRTSRKR